MENYAAVILSSPNAKREYLNRLYAGSPSCASLAGHELALVLQHRPVLDELIEVERRPGHSRPSSLTARFAAGDTILSGTPTTGVVSLLDALPSALTAGIRPWRPFWLALTAEAWQRLGRLEAARRLVDLARSEIEAMGSSFSLAEVLRLRGELLAAMEPERRAEALADLRKAERQAEAQGAVVYRDRASASAAGLERPGHFPAGTD